MQEVWTTALTKRPKGVQSMRAWLGRVTRNHAAKSARGDLHRDYREARVAEDAAPAREVALDREFELQRLVSEVVHNLDEPHRRTVLLRYFKELSHAEIAKETAVPIATVRTRLQRGLALVREELDRRHGGKRVMWESGMVALIGKDFFASASAPAALGGSVLASGVLMSLLAKIGLGLALVFCAVMLTWEPDGGPAVAPELVGVGSGVGDLTRPSKKNADDLVVLGEDEQSKRTPLFSAGTSEGEDDDSPKPTASIRGTLLLPSGLPARGLKLEIPWVRKDTTEYYEKDKTFRPGDKFVEPENWEPIQTQTDKEGRFHLTFSPPLGSAFDVLIAPAGLAAEKWSYRMREDVLNVDWGPVHLRETGVIEGRVLDRSGEPSSDAWHVSCRPSADYSASTGKVAESIWTSASAGSGAFRIEGIPAGEVDLEARKVGGDERLSARASVLAGEVQTVDFIPSGPDPARRIRVFFDAEPFRRLTSAVDTSKIRIYGQGVDRFMEAARWSSEMSFADLAPGLYTISLEDNRFEPWSQSGIKPGEDVTIKIASNASVRLTVLDGDSGEQVAGVHARIRMDDHLSGWPNTFDLCTADDFPSGGLFPRVPGGNVTILIDAAGDGAVEISLRNVEPGEVRAVDAVMWPPVSIRGQVLTSAGMPAIDVPVLLMPEGARPAPVPAYQFNGGILLGAVVETKTDFKGRYEFEGLVAATYDVYAVWTPWIVGKELSVKLEPGSESAVDLQMPKGATLALDLVGLGEMDPTILGIRVRSEPDARVDTNHIIERGEHYLLTRIIRVDADGRCRIENLPQGLTQIELARVHYRETVDGAVLDWSGGAMSLGAFDLKLGETFEREVDLAEAMPGTLSIRLLVNGELVRGVRVRAERQDGARWIRSGEGTTDQSGEAKIDGLFPGTYRALYEVDWNRTLCSLGRATLEPGGATSIEIRSEGVAGAILVTDAEGQPLGGVWMMIRGSGQTDEVGTNSEGLVEVLLEPGEYTLHLRAGSKEPPLLLWPSQDGEPTTVKFP